MKMSFKIKTLLFALIISLTVLLCSCEGDAKIRFLDNGNVSFEFKGYIDGYFKDMMLPEEGGSGIDKEAVKRELLHSGFSNVKVSDSDSEINISFLDEKRKSPLFTLDIVTIDQKDNISLSITPEKFLALYNVAGEELQSILDLFLSPVLNEEVMGEEEYVETISVSYGEEAGEEIDKSVVNFSIIDKQGNTKKRSIFVKNILCGGKIFF